MTNTKNCKLGRVFSYMRWSSEPQSWGDSERRQAEMALDWCKRNGKTLSYKTFADRGVSAWRGDNRKSGALGALLRIAGENDTILLEDTDRWSREEALDALTALRTTVQRGVEVVFLKRGVTVNKNNFNEDAVLIPLFFSSMLANKENEKRSYRIKEAMKGRRAKIESGKAVPGSMPCWLKWDEEKETAVIDEKKASSVRKLFQLSLSGLGVQAILHQFMVTKVPCPSNSSRSKWNTRLIHRLLRDKAVIGWHTSSGTPGVFPSIISEEDFYASCRKMAERKKFSAPIKWANGNLFTGFLKCSVCGGPVIKCGSGHKNIYSYLCCAGHREKWKKSPCPAKGGIRYERLEESFLALLAHTDLIYQALAGPSGGPSKLDALRGELADVQRQCEKYMRFINDDENPSRRIMDNLKLLESKEAQLQNEIQAEEIKTKSETPASEAYSRFQTEFATHVKDPEYRSRVREALKDIVESIRVEVGGNAYQVRLRQATMPIDVILGRKQKGWLFNPSPRYALKG